MVQAMLAGVASIKAQQTRMNVIGNNLANVNTTAFKSGRVTFQDMMSQTMRGASSPTSTLGGLNPIQYGLGVLVSGTDTNNEQGSLQATNRPTDMSIQGNGYFMLSDGSRNYYTRDGAFDIDASGDIVHRATGQRLMGWTADPATGNIDSTQPITTSSVLNVPIGLKTALQQTTQIDWTGNLDSRVGIGITTSSTVRAYDSLGSQHDVKLTFTKDSENTWSWTAASDGGSAVITGSGTITFNSSNGRILTGQTGTLSVDPSGSAPAISMEMDFSPISQVAADSQVKLANQNGFPPGSLRGFSIGTNGVITGMYTNGLTRSLGQVALAVFSNPGGLERQGSNLFRDTDNSGIASVGQPLVGGRGQVSSGFLEQSNVDIGQEFTDLIITQRGFQANTKVVTTVDEMLQDLINMKR